MKDKLLRRVLPLTLSAALSFPFAALMPPAVAAAAQPAKTAQAIALAYVPFKDFVGKNGGTFHPERLQHFAIYCNTVGDDAVDSHFYIDDIHAVKQ
ncbi:MAG: hypothetical protein SPL39_10940 [Selenomonadaceae bacterium]|nr:hypothetical protein [Selenomonadaceae bacterium]